MLQIKKGIDFIPVYEQLIQDSKCIKRWNSRADALHIISNIKTMVNELELCEIEAKHTMSGNKRVIEEKLITINGIINFLHKQIIMEILKQ